VKVREVFSRLNRVQQTMPFKVVASVALVALAVTAFAAYYMSVTVPAAKEAAALSQQMAGAMPAATTEQEREARSAIDASQRVLLDIAQRRASPANVGIGVAVVAAVGLAAIWLNLGLTYLGLVLVAGAVVGPMYLLGGTDWASGRRWSRTTSVGDVLRSVALLFAGLIALAGSFMALMQGARVLLSAPTPVFAVARNVMTEAVRMKISLVFIVMLVFALAALPLVLDPTTPLRYRVQSFLQYGTGGTFWIIAVLTLFFSASSVASEQRDRQIWQTMTKPVSAAQYLLGKWLGVVTLNAVLLAVSCAGIFLFTEYLRKQPAEGERMAMVSVGGGVSMDRLLLETQVLTARARLEPQPPVVESDQEFQNWVKNFIADRRGQDPDFAKDDETFVKVSSDLYKSYLQQFRSILAGESKAYMFTGLEGAKRRNIPLTVKYKVDSGSNDPSVLYKISFIANGRIVEPQEVGLGVSHTLTLYPSVIEDGRIYLEVVNGALVPAPGGGLAIIPNADMIVFPSDGLELFFTAGSYQGNFFRVAVVLWVKLAFLAMLAVTASTFLSFPVACLIAFSVFIGAEGAGFLKNSLEHYDYVDPQQGTVNYFKVMVKGVGMAVAGMFSVYHELKPTMRLVDGRLLTWESMSFGLGVLLVWAAVLYGIGVAIFRRRELATYSGT
jgi:ABC-type transport system involved in multi-copper enzyme maturation permease subunit